MFKPCASWPTAEPASVRPTSVTIDLTFDCPFRCRGCIEASAMKNRELSLTTATACNLVTQFAEQGGEEVLLYGGEPTLHPGFPAVARHAARLVSRIQVVTNGAFLADPAVRDAVIESAAVADVRVRVSLNAGTAATHEKLHGAEGYFQKVLAGMAALVARSTEVDLGVSFLVEADNCDEMEEAYRIATSVGARHFYLRAKTGLHGIGLVPLSRDVRRRVLEGIAIVSERTGPQFHIEPWHVRYLETAAEPDTSKPYPACYFCAASRLVVTPPEPGVVWGCTYFRADPRFHVADLSEAPFGSSEFEERRLEAIRRIVPGRDCAGVICNRHEPNRAMWSKPQVAGIPTAAVA